MAALDLQIFNEFYLRFSNLKYTLKISIGLNFNIFKELQKFSCYLSVLIEELKCIFDPARKIRKTDLNFEYSKKND